MRRSLVTAISLTLVCAACGGGGGGGGAVDPKPPDPCRDLGYGAVPAGMVGGWKLHFASFTESVALHENGAFVNGSATGFWGLRDDGKFTLTYSLTTECPPTGTLITATGVTATDTVISGEVVSSPLAGLTGTTFSLER